MNLLTICRDEAKKNTARVVFPDSLDVRTIKAASTLIEEKLAKPVLIAAPEELRDFCVQRGLVLPPVEIVNIKDSVNLTKYADHLQKKNKDTSVEKAHEQLSCPLWFSGCMLALGDVDYCVAGNVSSTANVLRAGLKTIGLQKEMKTLSSMFFMISPHQDIFGFGDCGVVPDPTSEQLADIAISTADNYARVTGSAARVAMLSFSTMGSAKHPHSEKVIEAVQFVKSRRPDITVDGEMQFDAAFVPAIAQSKAPNSNVAGKANVFIFPNLSAGNITYKAAERLGGFTALGPMVQGLAKPMHDLSRGCSADDMVSVTLLAMKMNPTDAVKSASGKQNSASLMPS